MVMSIELFKMLNIATFFPVSYDTNITLTNPMLIAKISLSGINTENFKSIG
jgi:hypothetical protein